MKRLLMLLGLLALCVNSLAAQVRTAPSKGRQILALYEKLLATNERRQHLEDHLEELQKEVSELSQSESPLTRAIGAAILLGGLKISLAETSEAVKEQDSLITQLVGASTGLTGDPARYADEGVRLLREQYVYLQRQLKVSQALVDKMTEFLGSINEEHLSQLPDLWEQQDFDADQKTLDEIEQKRELVSVQAKDAFSRLKAVVQ